MLQLRLKACSIVALLASAGCYRPERVQPEQLDRGYIVLLPGIKSTAWQFADTVKGLREAKIDRAIDIVEWGEPTIFSLANLTNLPVNRERARSIADRIRAYRTNHPDRPVTLVGFSGGGGMAMLVADALDDDVCLDRLILFGAAISPRYDLSAALGHCREGVVNFYSPGDWLTLGLGTKVFGTIDRVPTESAGYVGFQSTDGDLADVPGLEQREWSPAWASLGHDGGHLGWLARGWARDVLAPAIDPALATQ